MKNPAFVVEPPTVKVYITVKVDANMALAISDAILVSRPENKAVQALAHQLRTQGEGAFQIGVDDAEEPEFYESAGRGGW